MVWIPACMIQSFDLVYENALYAGLA